MRVFCTALGGLALLASAASAEQCEGQVVAFAETHGLRASPPEVEHMGATEPAPPATLESRGMGEESLDRSAGVAQQPVDGSAREPAGIPPKEEVATPTREEQSLREAEAAAETEPPRTESERRIRAENFVLGAIGAARQGREKECLGLLQQAKDVI